MKNQELRVPHVSGDVQIEWDVAISPLLRDKRIGLSETQGVLVIYCGGTIGSVPSDSNDPDSPQIVVTWQELRKAIPKLNELPFAVDAVAFLQPLDSANVGPKHWRALAEVIRAYYDEYEGFVIVHGTDTMVYTASALSFMLRGIDKPIVITGAQISAISRVRSDAEQNLLTAIQFANPSTSRIPTVPEVCIFFGNELIRGNRARKVNASGFSAFDSPNYPPLATAGTKLEVNTDVIRTGGTSFETQPFYDTNVIALDLYPGVQYNTSLLRAIINAESLKGIVLKTYGSGNVPTEPLDLIQLLDRAIKRGVVVVNVTQCLKGYVDQSLFDTSAILEDIGVISGREITPEAALCKLMCLLGDPDLEGNTTEIRTLMMRNLAGEQDYSIRYATLDNTSGEIGRLSDSREHRFPRRAIEGLKGNRGIQKIFLRLTRAQVLDTDKAMLSIYVNLGIGDDPKESRARRVGTYTKQRMSEERDMMFELTNIEWEFLDRMDASFTLSFDGEGGRLKWKKAELVAFSRD